MNLLKKFAVLFLFAAPFTIMAEEDIPPTNTRWNESEDPNRALLTSPSFSKDANHVYVYSEKQLDNVTISITDMQGNTYHYEVTTVPAGIYYAVSIESLPSGQYYFCLYQGNNYVIGIFNK